MNILGLTVAIIGVGFMNMSQKAIAMDLIEFDGEHYRDDRMYILHIAKCTKKESDLYITTTIYHDEPPDNYHWCLVTYRNNERYSPTRVDDFASKADAETYLRKVEPSVPLISLGGQSRNPPLPYKEFVNWKSKHGFQEFDVDEVFKYTNEDRTLSFTTMKRR